MNMFTTEKNLLRVKERLHHNVYTGKSWKEFLWGYVRWRWPKLIRKYRGWGVERL